VQQITYLPLRAPTHLHLVIIFKLFFKGTQAFRVFHEGYDENDIIKRGWNHISVSLKGKYFHSSAKSRSSFCMFYLPEFLSDMSTMPLQQMSQRWLRTKRETDYGER